ncbi:MAG: hypothetical protein WAW06_11175 [bacterium]
MARSELRRELRVALFLWALASSPRLFAASGDPYVGRPSANDFACVSGEVISAEDGKPLAGVGICVFSDLLPADTSVSAGSIFEGSIEYPLPPMPALRWVQYTDARGKFAVCSIPAWLAKETFTALAYKPGYVPEFSLQISSDPLGEPVYGMSISLYPSGP